MNVACQKCGEFLGTVQSTARLLLTVHCPFCGHDGGVAVDPPQQTELPQGTAAGPEAPKV